MSKDGAGKLASIEEKKELANQDLKKHMQQISVDMNRLKQVEDLALALKEGGISDKELKDYVQRQQVLNKAGIGIDAFVLILEKAKVDTSQDHGEELLQMLSEYGNLSEAKKALYAKVQSLEKEAHGLEQKAKLKGKIESEIAKLKAEKDSLESYIPQLHTQKNELYQIQSEVGSLAEKKAKLEQETTELEGHRDILSDDIKAKEQKVGDLKELESKHDALLASVSDIEAKLSHEKSRLQIFDAFLGVVGSTSITKLEEFITGLPALLDLVKQGKHSPELLRAMIVKQLTGGSLQVMKCSSCGAKFSADQSPSTFGYNCSCCGRLTVMIDQDEIAVLKKALAGLKPTFIFVERANEQLKPPISEDKAGS